jgi:hypothetical protein
MVIAFYQSTQVHRLKYLIKLTGNFGTSDKLKSHQRKFNVVYFKSKIREIKRSC